MGKLPIISRGDTPDDAASNEQRSAAGSAIALREECARGNSAEKSGGADRPVEVTIDLDAKSIATIAARIGRRRRDVVALSRGHTWTYESSLETDRSDRRGSTCIIDRERNCPAVPSATSGAERRIAGDDRDVTIAVASLSARKIRKTRDRVIRGNLIGSHTERRNRRHGDVSPDCGGSSMLRHATINSITPEGQNRSSVSPAIGITDISSGSSSIEDACTSTHVDAHARSAVTVFEVREPIGNDNVNDTVYDTSNRTSYQQSYQRSTDNDPVSSRRSGLIARLIGIAGFAERSRFSAERTSASGSSFFSQLPAKIDPGGSKRTKTDHTWGASPRIRLRGSLLLGLLAMCLLCDIVVAAPSSSSSSSSSTLQHSQTVETFEDGIEEEELTVSRNKLGDDELEIIRRSIVQGLGLQRIPDASKANVSQAEYERAHREYLKRMQLSYDGQETRVRRDLHVFRTAGHPGNRSGFDVSWSDNHRHSLYFPVTVPGDMTEDVMIDHATLRFLLRGDHRHPRDLEALVYLRTPGSRRLLARRSIPQSSVASTDSRWLELDTTEAATSWLERHLENRGLELEFLHDGRPTQRDVTHASLNVFTVSSSEPSIAGRRKRSTPEELMPLHKGRRSKCKGDNNKKCCRHELTVMFKDLKGFDFIVYPKGFDAGYCKGRCPPRYNPAHHHALLQSLLWKEDRKRVPKPCCAPSKLEQLMILYFDENDSTQLKVSYWKNIQVLECACS